MLHRARGPAGSR